MSTTLSSRHRLRSRIPRHHVPLGIIAVGLTGLLYWLFPGDDPLWKFSISTAYVSLVLLAMTLLLGPFNILTGRRNTTSIDLRRDIGIWAGIVGILHVIVGLQVHFRGRMWLLFMPEKWTFLPVRLDAFGFANHTGLLATLILLLLLFLSNDMSMRKFGGPKWKNLQRWNYACIGLTALHGVLYQILENRKPVLMIIFVLILLLIGAMQLLGFVRHRQAGAVRG